MLLDADDKNITASYVELQSKAERIAKSKTAPKFSFRYEENCYLSHEILSAAKGLTLNEALALPKNVRSIVVVNKKELFCFKYNNGSDATQLEVQITVVDPIDEEITAKIVILGELPPDKIEVLYSDGKIKNCTTYRDGEIIYYNRVRTEYGTEVSKDSMLSMDSNIRTRFLQLPIRTPNKK